MTNYKIPEMITYYFFNNICCLVSSRWGIQENVVIITQKKF
jgi:hypothetical protein